MKQDQYKDNKDYKEVAELAVSLKLIEQNEFSALLYIKGFVDGVLFTTKKASTP